MARTTKKALKKIVDIAGKFSIYADGLNLVMYQKNSQGRVIAASYFANLEELLKDMAESFVLEEISELKELLEFNKKFDAFCEEIRKLCKQIKEKHD